MIFGFNTDVRVDGTVYHVQSEVRETEHLLQTQVFVAGRCIGKRDFSFAADPGNAEISAETKHSLLREQHRWVLGCVRGGSLPDVFDPTVAGPLTLPASTPKKAVQNSGNDQTAMPASGQPALCVRFVSSDRPHHGVVALRFHVVDGELNATNATVAARIDPLHSVHCSGPLDDSSVVTVETALDGIAEVLLPIPNLVDGEACLTVYASTSIGKSCSRRFRLRIAN